MTEPPAGPEQFPPVPAEQSPSALDPTPQEAPPVVTETPPVVTETPPVVTETPPVATGPTAPQKPKRDREPDRVPPEPPRLALSLLILAAVGFSLALLVYELRMPKLDRAGFVVDNVIGATLRRPKLLLALAIGALIPTIVATGFWIAFRARAVVHINRWATLLAPLCLAFALPALFVWQVAQRNALMYLIMLSLFIVALRPLLARSFAELQELRAPSWALPSARFGAVLGRVRSARVPGFVYFATVVLGAAAYAAYTGFYTILNHHRIQTTAFDLGIYDNLMFNAMEGKLFRSPVLFGPGDRSYLAGHAEYGMLLFVPFYALKPGAETMLIIQAVMLGLAAIPLYLLGKQYLSRLSALLLAFAYLLFAPLHGPAFYDFHWLPIAIFFHFWLYYAIATKRTWLVVSCVLVLLAMREDIAVGLALLGAFLFITGARVRLGLALAIVSSVWFGINKFIIMPRAGAWWFETMYAELFADGKASYGSVIQTLLTNPVYAVSSFIRSVKLQYALHMVAPLAFLPVRKVPFLLLMIPGAMFTLMTTGYWPTTQISFQYTTHWIPYLFLTTVLGLWLTKFEPGGVSKRSAAMTVLVIAVVSHSYNFGSILQRESFKGGFVQVSFRMTPEEKQRYAALKQVVQQIPQKASVAATEYMNPHISARADAYAFRYPFGPVDYIFISSLEMNAENRRLLTEALVAHEYGIQAKVQEFFLFKKGLQSEQTAPGLAELGIDLGRKGRRRG